MCSHRAGTSGSEDDLDWLPPGVVRRAPDARRGLRARSDPRLATAALTALGRAPGGPVLVVVDRADSPFRGLRLSGRDVAVVDGPTLMEEAKPGPGSPSGPFAGCLLDGGLERTDRPMALLARVRDRLLPGGVLAVTTGGPAGGRWARRGDDRSLVFAGQTLPSLLFQAGFEAPQFFRRGAARLAVVRKSALAPPAERDARLSVIMPVYNEQETIEKTLELVLGKEVPGAEIEVIVVESNSTDGTREKVLAYQSIPRVSVILEEVPSGKGHAVRRGLEAAQGDFVLIQDADLEYDVDDYPALLEPLRRGETGFVLGLRTRPGGSWGVRHFGQDTTMSHMMNAGHVVFLALFNLVYQQKLRDPFTMYKVFRRDCLHDIPLECDRFDFDWELTGKLVRAGYRPLEIPVSYHSRSFAEGKKIRLWRDPLTWIRACFRYRFGRLYAEE